MLGDDAVQGFSGRNVSSFQKELEGPWKFWNETFVNGDMDGLALGIAGDTVRVAHCLVRIFGFHIITHTCALLL